jgi:putative flippase GtrA
MTTLVRFAVVGVANTIVTLVSFALLTHFDVPRSIASALAFGLGAANGYRLNRTWTFHSERRGAGVAARYVGVQALGALLSAVAIGLLRSEFLVLPLVTLVTFTLSRRLVFGGPSPA